jgi:hypothetical protein
MRRGCATVTALLLFVSAHLAFGCSCSNNVPIQRTAEKYSDRAVFTAHVTQLMGRIYNWDGNRLSSQVLAVVKERHWGLPWYWPKVVILDGSYPCDIAMEEGQDYLVSGRRERYGVLNVAVCSRTQPLNTAQVDLRALDGSHCAGPGGTIIGRVEKRRDDYHVNPTMPGALLTFHDADGKTYTARSDKDGIYELQHLATGEYTLDSHLSETQYFAGGAAANEGVCGEAGVVIKNYQIAGRLMPGLKVGVNLVSVDKPEDWWRADLRPDGEFYFDDVMDGEYLLSVESTLLGRDTQFYYPGTYDRRKATRIRIGNHAVVGPNRLDFNPALLPFVPIRVALDPPKDSGKYSWRILLVSPDNIVGEERWREGLRFVTPFGVRGRSYRLRLFGDPNYRTSYNPCSSEDVPVTATPGLTTIRIAVPAACR